MGPGFRGAMDDGAVGFVEGEVGGVPGCVGGVVCFPGAAVDGGFGV